MIFDTVNENPVLIKIVAGMAILFIGLVFGRFIGNLIKAALKELETNRIVKSQVKRKLDVENHLSGFVKYLIYLIAFIIALTQIGIGKTFLYVFLGILILILAVLLVIGLREVVVEFFYGLLIKIRGNIHENERIHFDNIKGTVVKLGWLETLIQEKEDKIFVPNNVLAKAKIIKENVKI